MGSLEWANWALVIVSIGLVIATCFYAYYTKKMMIASKEQIEAFKALTQAIQNIPSSFEHMKIKKELAEQEQKARTERQRKATGG